MMNKDLIIELLRQQLQHQAQIISEQARMIKLLEARVAQLENNQRKDSSNSSKPPSSDIGKVQRTRSLRRKSGKKPGGQNGHGGETLCFSSEPDRLVFHANQQCVCCGKDLEKVKERDYDCRQVFDIPPIKMQITEHRSEIKNCPRCHSLNKAAFPANVTQPVQYGINVQQLAVYFTQYQLLPYGRTAEIFRDLFGHSVSSSFLVNNNSRCASGLQPFINELKKTLQRQPVLHVDETGFYFEGRRNWLHTVSTDKHSLYVPHHKRGIEAMNEIAILPQYEGILVHDCWKPYYGFDCIHALCNVHHLRDLTFCHEIEKSNWAGQVKEMLVDLHAKVTQARQAGQTDLSKGQFYYWSSKYDNLMDKGKPMHPVPKKQKGKRGAVRKSKTGKMLERFIDCKEQILAFAKNFQIPFGNNIAEQAIRMMKVKQKISGCFRSEQGAKDFAVIRSYIATMKKQGHSIIQALAAAIQGNPITGIMG